MPSAVACKGCGKTIYQETSSSISVNAEIVGYVHKMPVSPSSNITPHCVRLAFWRLQEQKPGTEKIVVEGKTFNMHNTPSPKARRPSGSGVSAAPYATLQKPIATHTFHSPSRHF
ncbi:MAG: hypothetical protein NTX72_01545 [Candidatus Uhrbacteria bacterium]|nr:hypothetical protein [Candidatus Uhrbacteria bacterium]